MAAVEMENGSDYRPPPHVVDLCDQLAVAAATDFARRLRDVAKESDSTTSSSAGPSGSSTTAGACELFSHVDELANHFARRFTCFLSENFEALARDESEGGAAAAFGSEDNLMQKGSKLRRSFKKKFSRKHKDHAEKKARKRLEKETVLKQLVELDGSSMQWVKCRVMLKREPGGYMINFFSPPKSTKPRSGIFCFLIIEVRQTTNLELPDVEHSFVIKGQNSMEYILECHNNTEMWSWIAAIRECARNDAINRGLKTSQAATPAMAESSDDEDAVPPPPPPEDGQENIPPHTSELVVQAASREGSTHSLTGVGQGFSPKTESTARSSTEMLHLDNTLPTEYLNTLAAQPWFHGMLSRQEATMLVCQGAAQAHGTFLVRQSESRHGQMVLTFNCHGRAKHLRMTMMPDGTCRVQQWTFDNIFHLIDYFKVHPVPLDTGVDSDVVLTSYVMAATASSAMIQTPPPAVTSPAKPACLPLQRMNSSGGLAAMSPGGPDHSYVNTVFFPVGQPVPVASPTSVQPPSVHQRTNSVGSIGGTPSRSNASSQSGSRPRSQTFADCGDMRPASAPRKRSQNNYQFT